MAGDTELAYGIAPPGARLPDGTKLGRVRLAVSNLARALAWYERVVGVRVLEHAETRATLGAQGNETPLIELHEQPGARAVPRRGRIGLYHYAILLPDRASLGRFLVHLAAIGEHPGMADHAVSEALYLHDPDGLGIEVYADRPRSEWRHEGRELFMTTAPLDVQGVLSAVNEEPWTGLPAGTVMGHVHLHVGDLAEAAAFYHEALGFDKMVWSYPGALFLSAGGYHHHLGTNTWAAHAEPAGEGDARLLDWEILLPTSADVDRAARSLESGGHTVDHGGSGVSAADPWGTRLRLAG
jgi:catechol 2,3-dioxygenase